MTRQAYADPYVVGVGIGLVLTAAFVLVGNGLGASGAFNSAAAAAAQASGAAAERNAAFAPYLADGGFVRDWLVWEIAGVMIGAWIGARRAGRLGFRLERGAGVQTRTRVLSALGGGMLMGFGARLVRGCTSGQALTGGSMLSVGSWIFIITCFAAAFAVTPLVRRQWQ